MERVSRRLTRSNVVISTTSGGDGDRTHYLLHAMQALYQLSYAPVGRPRYQPAPALLTGSLGRYGRRSPAAALQRRARQRDRAQVAGTVGRAARLLHTESNRPAERRPASSRRSATPVRARHVSLPEWYRA